jgi:hypothetical protein
MRSGGKLSGLSLHPTSPLPRFFRLRPLSPRKVADLEIGGRLRCMNFERLHLTFGSQKFAKKRPSLTSFKGKNMKILMKNFLKREKDV